MPVNLTVTPAAELYPVPGVRWGIAEAGIRKVDRKDLSVLLLDEGASVGAVFTQNRFCAAPVQVCREHLAQSAAEGGQAIRAMLINTGNANAGTGEDGLSRARSTCVTLAAALGLAPAQILPFSTGVTLGGATVTITGISKGAGMIRPNMATMLGFLATDAAIAPELMAPLAKALADASFNRITIDGDTSTNDSFIVVATGQAAHAPITSLDSADGQALFAALRGVAQQLAQAIVRDGEGATKFIAIRVEGGKTGDECRQVGYAIAHSPLVKTAFFASDPNLGRILAAVGYAGITDLDQTKIDLYLDDVLVAKNGGRHADYVEADGQRVMKQSEITVRVVLGRGEAADTVWTCDLSYEYVKINADYRS